jgi:hypothetical protein
MGRIGRILTFFVVVVGAYFALRAIAPAPLHDFLVFVDDFALSVRSWVHSAEQASH